MEHLFEETSRRFPGALCLALGHLGDGNIHLSIASEAPFGDDMAVEALVYDGLRVIGGAFSAEHGVGLDKRAALARLGGATRLAAMRAIKQALDPEGRMNPGKVLEV